MTVVLLKYNRLQQCSKQLCHCVPIAIGSSRSKLTIVYDNTFTKKAGTSPLFLNQLIVLPLEYGSSGFDGHDERVDFFEFLDDPAEIHFFLE